jgi:hypothetical protein
MRLDHEIPRTPIFDSERAQKGYALNRICFSFNDAVERMLSRCSDRIRHFRRKLARGFSALLVGLAAALLPLSIVPLSPAVAQSFTKQTMLGSDLFVTGPDTDFWITAIAPADVDGDGDLDLAVLGFYVVYHQSVEHILVIFRNDGAAGSGWSFTEQRIPLGEVFSLGASDLAWGDYDNDGDPDLAVGSEGATVLYRNDAGTLVPAATNPSVLPGYDEVSGYTGAYDLRSITWADVDNDGDLDLLLPSVFDRGTLEYSTRLLRNDGDAGGAWRFTDIGVAIDPTVHAQSAWADDDGDGDLDLFLVNVDPDSGTGFIKRFENVGGDFVGEDLLGIRVEHGLAEWGDYDADGDLDILVAGLIQEEDGTFATTLRIYRNDGGTYTPIHLPLPNPNWLDIHAATWADYDSDGDIDLLVTGSFVGESEIEGQSEIYRNTGGTFTPLGVALPAPFDSIGRGGAFTWFDLDNDGDLDYLVAGAYFVPGGNGLVEAQINLFRNDTPAVNRAPTAPSALATRVGRDGIRLDWAAASDDVTPEAALTYELELRRAGQTFGRSRREPAPGTLGATDRSTLTLPPGRYKWSVRAVDAAYNSGPRTTATLTVAAATSGLSVSATPVNPPVRVPAAGGSFRYHVQVENTSRTWKAFELWVLMAEPGNIVQTVRRLTGSVAAGAKFRTALTQNVPPGFPQGKYVQTVSLERTAPPKTSDSFTWFKR